MRGATSYVGSYRAGSQPEGQLLLPLEVDADANAPD